MSLQETLAARAAAAAAQSSQIATGVQSSTDTAAAVPAETPAAPTKEEVLAELDTENLPEHTFFLLGDTRQLLMPRGIMRKADAQNMITAQDEGQLQRLEYFAQQNLCVRVK